MDGNRSKREYKTIEMEYNGVTRSKIKYNQI